MVEYANQGFLWGSRRFLALSFFQLNSLLNSYYCGEKCFLLLLLAFAHLYLDVTITDVFDGKDTISLLYNFPRQNECSFARSFLANLCESLMNFILLSLQDG